NVAIGHSGGKFLTERHGIPVIRAGFPVHDRIGGQRILSVGYAGSLAFLDRFTNTLLEKKYSTYRQLQREEMMGINSIGDA
ncbi:MAG: nitrogenase component 1, partial [Methanoregula sp.]|nr:nitrogenase component 1 [Methanoregula sp.]